MSMASIKHLLSSLLLLSLLSLSSASSNPPHVHALVLPVKKDAATKQYVTRIRQRTPLRLLNLVVDLGGRFLWVDCERGYVSSTYRPVRCETPQCEFSPSTGCGDCFLTHGPGCNNNTCAVDPQNPFLSTVGELAQDSLALRSTDGSSSGPLLSINDFIFTCAPSFLLKGLARGAAGMAGLGRNRIGLPIQLAVEFTLQPKFALCLASSPSSDGAIFFGEGPYRFHRGVELFSPSFTYTPLLINRVSTSGTYVKGEKSVDHFIGVTAIKFNNKLVPVDDVKTLLVINKGRGGTKLSTVAPYTELQSSIFKALTGAFDAGMSKASRVPPVGPFKLCYNAKSFGSDRFGPTVPQIDLVLHNENVSWKILGSNYMVPAKEGVLCLGFIDAGEEPVTSIVIGGYQLENHLLQFDLKKSVLGFTSSLLLSLTDCGNFNFTSEA